MQCCQKNKTWNFKAGRQWQKRKQMRLLDEIKFQFISSIYNKIISSETHQQKKKNEKIENGGDLKTMYHFKTEC